ncbi:hypothetical protein B6K86_05720 [Lachnospiraceae bacterium]|nr:hypothetical protein B6K86_05720 [Lachnospiraceae bacterium]
MFFFVQHSLIHWILCAGTGGKVFTEYYIFFVKFGMNEEGRGRFDFAEQGQAAWQANRHISRIKRKRSEKEKKEGTV